MKSVLTTSAEKTWQFAEWYLENKLESNVLALYGDLGSGKTTFTQGIARALGINEQVTSPTFILMRSYSTTSSTKGFRFLYHVDLYRVSGCVDVDTLDLVSIWRDTQNLVVIEWPERIKDNLPVGRENLRFEYLSKMQRKISFD